MAMLVLGKNLNPSKLPGYSMRDLVIIVYLSPGWRSLTPQFFFTWIPKMMVSKMYRVSNVASFWVHVHHPQKGSVTRWEMPGLRNSWEYRLGCVGPLLLLMVQKSGQPVEVGSLSMFIPLFTGFYTSKVVSRISSINSSNSGKWRFLYTFRFSPLNM